MTTTTTTSYAPPSAARRSWRTRNKSGSAFGTKPLPDVPLLAEAFSNRGAAMEAEANLKLDRDELVKSRVIDGNRTLEGLTPAEEREYEVALSDVEHRLKVAARVIRENDHALLAAAADHAEELREAIVAATAKADDRALKSFDKFRADFAARQDAHAVAAWVSDMIAGRARPYVGPREHSALATIAAALVPESARQSEVETIEEFIDQVGWANILKPLQIGSLSPSAWHPRAIANEVDVSIEVVKAVIADRMRRHGR
jgi:hypothetical protein